MDGLADMHEYSTKPVFFKFLEYDPFVNINETKKYLEKLLKRSNSKTGHYWFIKLNSNNKIIGTFGLLDIDTRKGITEIGYGISPENWSNGYFSEALLVVLKYLFNDLNFQRVWAKTQSNNIPSIRALENFGFKKEGTLRNFYLSTKGIRYDSVILGLLRNEFKDQ